jgi:hypothetical protein
MHKYAYQVLTALTLVAWLMVPATHAQSIMLKADIPFNFVVGDTQLPSGEYHVKKLQQGVVQLQGKATRSSAIVMTTGVQAGKTSDVGKLVFNRYGDNYFLSAIWEASSITGRQLRKSRLEREVAVNFALGQTTVAAIPDSRK